MELSNLIDNLFPRNAKKIKKHIILHNSSVIKAEIDTELRDYYMKKTRNLPLNIYVDRDELSDFSPYTIIALVDKTYEKNFHMLSLPFIYEVFSLTHTTYLLSKLDINGYNKDGIVYITYNQNVLPRFRISFFEPVKYVELFKNYLLERAAIGFHEIGHWRFQDSVYFNRIELFTRLFRQLFFIYSLFIKINGYLIFCLFIIFYLLINGFASLNEESADDFVKKLGYGKHLASGLRLFFNFYKLKIRSDKNIIKISDTFRFKLEDFLNRIFQGYPSIEKRIYNLIKENIDFDNVEQYNLITFANSISLINDFELSNLEIQNLLNVLREIIFEYSIKIDQLVTI